MRLSQSSDVRLRHPSPCPGRPRDADGRVHRVHALPVRGRSGDEHPGAGRDAAAAPGAAPRPRPRQPVSGAVRAVRGPSGAGRVRSQSAAGTQGLVADRRAAPGDARAHAAGRRPRLGHRHSHGRLRRAQARNLPVAGDDDHLVARCLPAALSRGHPAHPGLRRDPQMAAQLRPRRGDGIRSLDHGNDERRRLAPSRPACNYACRVPAHADHATRSSRDARSPAHRLHQVRPSDTP